MDYDFQGKIFERSGKQEIFDTIDELKVGIEVSNEAEAYNLWNTYAFRKGFSICKGNIRRDVQNNVRQRDYFCSKEGFQSDEDLCGVTMVRRLDTRAGCKALIRFTMDNGIWKISHINLDHNHEFAKPEERQFVRSGQHIPSMRAAILGPKVYERTSPTKSNPWEKSLAMLRMLGPPIKIVIIICKVIRKKCFGDPSFFYSVQVDQFNQITNYFWRDGRSKLDYDCFGDAVCFDTTFRTKKYNLICAPFVDVNHHCKNVLFGCAFVSDESTDSFIWLFETFLEFMGYKQQRPFSQMWVMEWQT